MTRNSKPIAPSRVYVVQRQERRDSTGNYVPKFDLQPAEEFGEIVYLLPPEVSPFRLGPVHETLQAALKDMRASDYLLLIGNPVFIGMAAIAASQVVDQIQFLIWSNAERRYITVREEL